MILLIGREDQMAKQMIAFIEYEVILHPKDLREHHLQGIWGQEKVAHQIFPKCLKTFNLEDAHLLDDHPRRRIDLLEIHLYLHQDCHQQWPIQKEEAESFLLLL